MLLKLGTEGGSVWRIINWYIENEQVTKDIQLWKKICDCALWNL